MEVVLIEPCHKSGLIYTSDMKEDPHVTASDMWMPLAHSFGWKRARLQSSTYPRQIYSWIEALC